MNFELPELKIILTELAELKQLVMQEKKELPVWLNDQQCWELKGGMAFNTYRNNKFYQVKGGIPDAIVGGRKVWKKESVLEWLPLNDEELVEYNKKYKTGKYHK